MLGKQKDRKVAHLKFILAPNKILKIRGVLYDGLGFLVFV
jgi:hypothetical protein